MNWYYVDSDKRTGPLSESQFEELVAAGRILPETMVWNESLTGWTAFREVRRPPAAAANAASSAPAPSAAAELVSCSQCLKVFPADEVMRFEDQAVCASCKPLFLQRLKEGAVLPGRLVYASFWERFAAKLLDGLIVGIPYMILFLLVFPGLATGGSESPIGVTCLLQVFFYVGAAFYQAFFLHRFGATPGKMALKLKVVTPDGGGISWGRGFGRFFAELLSGIILYIGYIMAAFDEEKRALHDRICDTRVIKTRA